MQRNRNTAIRTLPTASLVLALASVTVAGCRPDLTEPEDDDQTAMVPEDFVDPTIGDSSTRPSGNPGTANTTSHQQNPGDFIDAGPQLTDTTPPSDAVLINAMIGHVNGEAIYADQIFEPNLISQLETFGRNYDNETFRTLAMPEIFTRLRGVVIDRLVNAEAQRNLEDLDRRIVELIVQYERDEMLRFYGQGSQALAQAEFLAERGITLDQHLMNVREQQTMRIYLEGLILPRISVRQSQVEAWYEENNHLFNQPDRRIFRIIRIEAQDNPDHAQAVVQRLERGEAFEALASDAELNAYNPANSGLFNGGEFYPGDFGIAPVNTALQQLEPGQHAGPIPFGQHIYFVELLEIEHGQSVSLADAQVRIQELLHNQQYENHVNRLTAELLRDGSYSDLQEMAQTLLDIASARYDP